MLKNFSESGLVVYCAICSASTDFLRFRLIYSSEQAGFVNLPNPYFELYLSFGDRLQAATHIGFTEFEFSVYLGEI